MSKQQKLHVNGLVHPVQAKVDTPLLHVLRNELGLSGPMFGCGLAQCGACSILLDGKEIRSCVTPVAAVAGKRVTTIEGLPVRWANTNKIPATKELLHPVQQAWIDEQVPQCGYCQSGMMIQAVDLLETVKTPSSLQIKQAMNGHLCRCGTHARVVSAIQLASKRMVTS